MSEMAVAAISLIESKVPTLTFLTFFDVDVDVFFFVNVFFRRILTLIFFGIFMDQFTEPKQYPVTSMRLSLHSSKGMKLLPGFSVLHYLADIAIM